MTSLATLVQGVRASDRRSVARAITLVESRRPEDEASAIELLRALSTPPRRGLRIGVSGPPGVGKSSVLEALGLFLIDRGLKPFVLVGHYSSAEAEASVAACGIQLTPAEMDWLDLKRDGPT